MRRWSNGLCVWLELYYYLSHDHWVNERVFDPLLLHSSGRINLHLEIGSRSNPADALQDRALTYYGSRRSKSWSENSFGIDPRQPTQSTATMVLASAELTTAGLLFPSYHSFWMHSIAPFNTALLTSFILFASHVSHSFWCKSRVRCRSRSGKMKIHAF